MTWREKENSFDYGARTAALPPITLLAGAPSGLYSAMLHLAFLRA
jgi:hypothetical protein